MARYSPTQRTDFSFISREVRPSTIKLMRPGCTLAQREIQNEDTARFQIDISDREVRILES